MTIEVFDYRTDIRNIFVTSQIRSRFLTMDPGATADLHSHDLGHEIFLILQGTARFEICGEFAELKPGQLCIARCDEPHQVTVTSDEPMIMYLSVTPHIQPTHTGRDPTGERHPTRFAPPSAYDLEEDNLSSIQELVDRVIRASHELEQIAEKTAEEHRIIASRLVRAMQDKDLDEADSQREAMWFGIYRLYDQIFELGHHWNALAPRAGRTG
ncbi:MAG: cupin domain-containing protein [Candidatus Latescibacterota bacterium]|nr:cupin domain-containing protein [Candidatus Latescibacterota bacterium]